MIDRNGDGDHRRDANAAGDGPVDRDALDWVLRMAEPDADWDAFTAWLEADAGRAELYDQAASALRDAEMKLAAAQDERPREHVVPAAAQPMSPSPSIRHGSTRWIGAAVAAMVAGAIGLGIWTEMPRPYDLGTKAGEQRTIQMGDGTSIVLAGASGVRLDRSDPRVATVTAGEALFRVRHDADRPFAVTVGDLRLVDVGTVFDVKAADGRTRVAVAEGAVIVDPAGAAMRLDPGQAVVSEGGTLDRRQVDAADVAGWRTGRMAFDDAPLSEVASDLSRELGRRVNVAPSIAKRTFRGTLELGTVASRPTLLGQLLDVKVRQVDGGWTLEPAR